MDENKKNLNHKISQIKINNISQQKTENLYPPGQGNEENENNILS